MELRLPVRPPLAPPVQGIVLTHEEKQIIRLMLAGCVTNRAIAERMGSNETRVVHVLGGLFDVLNLQDWGNSRVRLVLWALKDPRFAGDVYANRNPAV